MKIQNYLNTSLLTVLLIIIIAVGLINTETFYSPNAFAYYSFSIIILVFVIISSFFNSKENSSIIFKTPLLLFGVWCCYILFHFFTNTATLVFTIYCIVLYFLFIRSTILFSKTNFNFTLFFIGIVIIASIESLYCIGQFIGWFKSQNELFVVTGSWNNPNVIAIFLALTTPVFLFLFKGKYKKIILFGFVALLIALLLLKCRAALIGTAMSVIVFYGLKYDFISWIKNKKNKSSAIALFILSLLIIIPISSHLYNAKKASADGRKFIWKVSAQMLFEKPLTGYGYGFFEREYNLFQANYIKQGKANVEELANAGPVIMPHNELVLNGVEGGLIGLILVITLFIVLLLTVKRRQKSITNDTTIDKKNKTVDDIYNLSYAGVIAFIGMSMINSTIQIVPIMCLFIIYAAIICSFTVSIKFSFILSFLKMDKTISLLTKTTIVCSSFYLVYLLFSMATTDSLIKKASILKKEKKYEQAMQIMPNLSKNIPNYSDYWKNYAAIYLETQQYSKALNCLERAKIWGSLPDVYNGSGFCYEKQNQYTKAINEYETLVALYPSKFLYRMVLLRTYLKNKDNTKAIVLAEKIIQLKPKIPSEKVNRYKNICYGILRKLNAQKTNTKPILFHKQSQLNIQ